MAETVVILYQSVAPEAGGDEQDTLVQAAFVRDALAALGFTTAELAVTLDLERVRQELKSLKPGFVFNLVESIGGRGEFIHVAPALLESLALPFSGCSGTALFLTSHKLLAKAIMRRTGLPTPDWFGCREAAANPGAVAFPCILKHVWEHASVGIDDSAVIHDRAGLVKAARAPGLRFLERFVEGREFNITLLETADGVVILPPAEICFTHYPEGKPKIVGYQAKWKPGSFEYDNTPVRHEFGEEDGPLLETLKQTALLAWRTFGLSGYARVDFRVDEEGNPFVLEINANPCLSPDAGFFKSASRAGYTAVSLVQAILEAGRAQRGMEGALPWNEK